MADAYTEQPETIGQAIPEAVDETRLAPATESLRHIAARGTVINAAFQIGLSGLATIKRLVVAAFLTRSEFGVWGIMLSILITLSWLKEIGVGD